MSTLGRTLKNFMKIGPSNYIKQMDTIGDTKWGRLVGTDVNGNKYFENKDEISGRERWVEFASKQNDGADITPEWHMWLARIVQEPPTEMNIQPQKWWGEPTPNYSGTLKSFKTYNTTTPKSYMRIVNEWPVDKVRPTRGMKQVLEKRVEEAFRAPSVEFMNLEKAHQELKALESLLDNTFKEKYPISDKILTPASNPNYYSKLMSSLEASKDSQKSTLAKLFGK
ncbi:NADH ubiquinone oxidoreductase subunit NDUFA12-domain-containing protein [Gilbertella persicaria]|uniref:NADH ubiquinone oxidoreductase subunit NDUFA12-domain-containing protein n=1 Tax=Gilbertella persicaria TaxID=101096 RepID=UPI00221FF29E|nr:NADH ubiquinone oxidoreductase subunit NDUFA12-domain-containing protein [Gilbertella persicaria]KAI8084258.1 NADH ubiquinone oxidoreductase subunit NDUFA12-domain-containing protein [Gilbertella persicaria]